MKFSPLHEETPEAFGRLSGVSLQFVRRLPVSGRRFRFTAAGPWDSPDMIAVVGPVPLVQPRVHGEGVAHAHTLHLFAASDLLQQRCGVLLIFKEANEDPVAVPVLGLVDIGVVAPLPEAEDAGFAVRLAAGGIDLPDFAGLL